MEWGGDGGERGGRIKLKLYLFNTHVKLRNVEVFQAREVSKEKCSIDFLFMI